MKIEDFLKLINQPLWVFAWMAIVFWLFSFFPNIIPAVIEPYFNSTVSHFFAIIITIGVLCKVVSILYTKYCKKPEPKKHFI